MVADLMRCSFTNEYICCLNIDENKQTNMIRDFLTCSRLCDCPVYCTLHGTVIIQWSKNFGRFGVNVSRFSSDAFEQQIHFVKLQRNILNYFVFHYAHTLSTEAGNYSVIVEISCHILEVRVTGSILRALHADINTHTPPPPFFPTGLSGPQGCLHNAWMKRQELACGYNNRVWYWYQ